MNSFSIDIVAGIASGVVANVVTHPLDTIKMRIQINSGSSVSMTRLFAQMY